MLRGNPFLIYLFIYLFKSIKERTRLNPLQSVVIKNVYFLYSSPLIVELKKTLQMQIFTVYSYQNIGDCPNQKNQRNEAQM